VIVPKSLRSFVAQELEADASSKSTSTLGRFWPAAAAAAVLLTFISQGDVGVANSDWEKLMGRHQRNLPMDVQGRDHSKVQRYFSGRLPFTVQLPRFKAEIKPPVREASAAAATLLGGRVTQFDNHDAAYVRYRLPKGNLSVFVYEDRGSAMPETGVFHRAGNRRVFIQRYRGYSIARWKNRGLVYSVISDLSEPEFRTVLIKRMAP
jgi:anti-sigma factor RsiW